MYPNEAPEGWFQLSLGGYIGFTQLAADKDPDNYRIIQTEPEEFVLCMLPEAKKTLDRMSRSWAEMEVGELFPNLEM